MDLLRKVKHGMFVNKRKKSSIGRHQRNQKQQQQQQQSNSQHHTNKENLCKRLKVHDVSDLSSSSSNVSTLSSSHRLSSSSADCTNKDHRRHQLSIISPNLIDQAPAGFSTLLAHASKQFADCMNHSSSLQCKQQQQQQQQQPPPPVVQLPSLDTHVSVDEDDESMLLATTACLDDELNKSDASSIHMMGAGLADHSLSMLLDTSMASASIAKSAATRRCLFTPSSSSATQQQQRQQTTPISVYGSAQIIPPQQHQPNPHDDSLTFIEKSLDRILVDELNKPSRPSATIDEIDEERNEAIIKSFENETNESQLLNVNSFKLYSNLPKCISFGSHLTKQQQQQQQQHHVDTSGETADESKEELACYVNQQSLIGDRSRFHILPCKTSIKHNDLSVIEPQTLARLLDGHYAAHVDRVVIIDSRYPYEYDAGHIRTAHNVYTRERLLELFLADSSALMRDSAETRARDKRMLVIFHCEFSSERGPGLLRFLRNQDRALHRDSYPTLYFPELYLLDGGYKAFYEQHRDYCVPVDYKPMLHHEHTQDLKHFRAKTKTWNSQQRQLQQHALSTSSIKSLVRRTSNLAQLANATTSTLHQQKMQQEQHEQQQQHQQQQPLQNIASNRQQQQQQQQQPSLASSKLHRFARSTLF